jgi:hypothetical protein
MKTCLGCKKELPDSSYNVTSDGRKHSRCKTCRAEYERKRRKRRKDERLDKIERDSVDAFCQAARLGGANIPHSSEMLETILEYMGGTRGFANLFLKQYYDSPPGGAFRTKQLDTIVRLVTSNTALGGAKKPLALWSEDELEDELRVRLMEAAASIRGLPVIDAQVLPVTEEVEKAPSPDT